MSYIEEFNEYTESLGFVQPYKNPSPGASGNGLLYTAEMLVILEKLKCIEESHYLQFKNVIEACEVYPGVLRRHPLWGIYQAHDDYTGVITAAMIMRHPILGRILMHGENEPYHLGLGIKLFFNFNNMKPEALGPNAGTWLGRMPQFVAHIQYANHRRPSLFHRFVFGLDLLLAAFGPRTSHDGWVMTWMRVEAYKRSLMTTWIMDQVVGVYCTRFRKRWKYGIGELLGDYFNDKNHPSARYGLGLFP